jgi:hypothetical protein
VKDGIKRSEQSPSPPLAPSPPAPSTRSPWALARRFGTLQPRSLFCSKNSPTHHNRLQNRGGVLGDSEATRRTMMHVKVSIHVILRFATFSVSTPVLAKQLFVLVGGRSRIAKLVRSR